VLANESEKIWQRLSARTRRASDIAAALVAGERRTVHSSYCAHDERVLGCRSERLRRLLERRTVHVLFSIRETEGSKVVFAIRLTAPDGVSLRIQHFQVIEMPNLMLDLFW
jgi:hypothetical protein